MRDTSASASASIVDEDRPSWPARRQRRRRERREHIPGRHRHARIDQHGRQFRQLERLGQDLADAAHHARARIEADRHVGAGRARGRDQPRVVERKTVLAREQAQRRGRIGRAAAEAGRDRQAASSSREAAEPQAFDPLGECARGLEHEIVGRRARRLGGRSGDVERERAPGAKSSRSPTSANTTRLSIS